MKQTTLKEYMKLHPNLMDDELAEAYLKFRKDEEIQNETEKLDKIIKSITQTLLPINWVGGVKGVFYKLKGTNSTEYIHIYNIDNTYIYYNVISVNNRGYNETYNELDCTYQRFYNMIKEKCGEESSLQEYFQIVTEFVIGRE